MIKDIGRERKYRYSEIFGRTFQGEGIGGSIITKDEYGRIVSRTFGSIGAISVWIRLWGCNFSCSGFSQKNINDPSTWITPYDDVDVSKYKTLEELPVFEVGCDSGYSWSKKFAHLARQGTALEICNEIQNKIKSKNNPDGLFLHPVTKQWIQLSITGGEPLMSQTAMVDILNTFEELNNFPSFVTVETNGTQKIREPLKELISKKYNPDSGKGWLWSCSPKLSTSGEKWSDAIRPEILSEYNEVSYNGHIKFVVDGSDQLWNEVEKATNLYREAGINWPVCIMPVGGTKEEQQEIQARICEECFDRGYQFSPRVHCFIFDNVIGK